jgi:hypothetical protein
MKNTQVILVIPSAILLFLYGKHSFNLLISNNVQYLKSIFFFKNSKVSDGINYNIIFLKYTTKLY